MFKRILRKDGEFLKRAWNWVKTAWTERPVSSLLLTLAFVGFVLVLEKTIRLKDTGFEPKTLWDWMDLLLVPLVLAIGGWWLNRTQRKTELDIANANREEDRKREDARAETQRKITVYSNKIRILERYLDRMSDLLLREDISTEQKGAVGRARTLAALRSLDSSFNVIVLAFLRDSGFSNFLTFRNATLMEIDVSEGDLAGFDFTSATIEDATRFVGTNMNEAVLAYTFVTEVIMNDAELRGANFQNAALLDVDLIFADLRNADFTDAALSLVDLSHSDLRGSVMLWKKCESVQFEEAKYDVDTEWPDGFDPQAAGAILVDDDGHPIKEPNSDGQTPAGED